MIPIQLQNTAIVVLAASNNPRLLNSDFLKRNKIVPENWRVDDTLVTPPVAHVIFENGLQVVVEEYRLHFQANKIDAFDWSAELPRISEIYMKTLPFVAYADVGLNFTYIYDISSNDMRISLQSLIKSGGWQTFGSGMTNVALELQYHRNLPQMNIKMTNLKKSEKGEGEKEYVMFQVNFHHPFQTEQVEDRFAFIRNMGARQQDFFDFIETIPF